MPVAMVCLVESLFSKPLARVQFLVGSKKFDHYTGTGCVSCVVSGGGPNIVLIKHSGRLALVYLCSVLVHSPLLLLQASEPLAFVL